MITMGSARASASEVVSPPALPTSRSAAAIHSSISVVNPVTVNRTGEPGLRAPGARRDPSSAPRRPDVRDAPS